MKALFISLLYFSLSFPALSQDAPWEFRKEEDGIKVFFRDSEESKIKQLKITFELDASLSTIMAGLRDIEAFPEWIYKCEESYLLERSEQSVHYYCRMDFPWPLSDRDVVSHVSFRQDEDSRIIYTQNRAVKGKVPLNQGVVRLETLDIQWVITPLGFSKSHIDYYLKSDPGGSLPSWLVNLAIDKGPIASIKAFRELVKRPEYQNVQIAGVR